MFGDSMKPSYDSLLNLYYELSAATLNHDVIYDHACVTADKLGEMLAKVDEEWYDNDLPKDFVDQCREARIELLDGNITEYKRGVRY
jgi:hypothetical protein